MPNNFKAIKHYLEIDKKVLFTAKSLFL